MSDPFDPNNPPIVPTPGGGQRTDPNANLIGGAMSSQAAPSPAQGLAPEMMEILALLGAIMQYKNGAGRLKGIFGGGDGNAPSQPVPIGVNGPPDGGAPAPAPAPTPGAAAGIAAPPTGGLQGIFGGGAPGGVATPDVGTGGGFQQALARRRGMGMIQ